MATEEGDASMLSIDGDDQFKTRSNAVFASLAVLERKHEQEVIKEDPFAENLAGVGDGQTKRKNRRPHRVPDHVLHPQKWTEYSLKEDGTSIPGGTAGNLKGDNLNKNIALDFLHDLKKRKKIETGCGDSSNAEGTSGKEGEEVQFHKPMNLKRKLDQLDDGDKNSMQCAEDEHWQPAASDSMQGNVIRMKAFEFGDKPEARQPKKVQSKSAAGVELSLSHLEENESGDGIDTQTDKETNKDNLTAKFGGTRRSKRNARKFHPEDDD